MTFRFRGPYFYLTAGLLAVLLIVLVCVNRPVKSERHIAERQAAGQTVPIHSYVEVYSWRGLLANIGLAAVLVALTPLASKRLQRKWEPSHPCLPTLRPWHWGLLALIVGGAAVANAPRLGHSLWGDEEYTMKRLIADQVDKRADGSVELEKTSWSTTFWSFRKPTNHIGYTVTARLFHDAFFRSGTGIDDPWFSETLVRLPVYLAGLLSILALFWAVQVWFGTSWKALILLIGYTGHAWFVRFGVDARGYGFVLLLVPCLIALMGLGVQTGRWLWWLAYGFIQFFLFWTYFGAVYVLVAFNLAALAMILMDREKGTDRLAILSRWVVGNLVSAMLVVALMAPCWPQLFEFLAQKPLTGSIDSPWLADAGAYMLSGLPWHPWDAANPLCVSWTHGGVPLLLTHTLAVILVILLAIGSWKMARQKKFLCLLLALIGAPALMLAHQCASGIKPYHWYLVPFLPGLFMLWAAAFPAGVSASGPASRTAILVLMAVGMLGLFAIALPEACMLRQHPIEPCRESVALTRKITNPRNPEYGKDAITGSFAFYTEAYDPALRRFNDVNGLRDLMALSDKDGKPLYINFGFKQLSAHDCPEIVQLLDDTRYFEHVSTLPGLFFAATREVYRYKNGTLEK